MVDINVLLLPKQRSPLTIYDILPYFIGKPSVGAVSFPLFIAHFDGLNSPPNSPPCVTAPVLPLITGSEHTSKSCYFPPLHRRMALSGNGELA